MPSFSQANGAGDNLPVGTILAYNGSIFYIPSGWHLCDGTDGTPNLLDGRFPEGDANPGVYIEAGLPNIQGFLSAIKGTTYSDMSGSGALYVNNRTGDDYVDGSHILRGYNIGFDASRSNPLFGASTTVQPKAYTVLYIIKVK